MPRMYASCLAASVLPTPVGPLKRKEPIGFSGLVGSSGGLRLLEEGGCVLLHQAVQRGLLRAAALVVDRGAVRRPLGLPANGLHTRLPRL